MVHHFVHLVGFGPFCNGACFCLFQLKGKKKGRVLRCVGVEKVKITLRKVTKVGWWVR